LSPARLLWPALVLLACTSEGRPPPAPAPKPAPVAPAAPPPVAAKPVQEDPSAQDYVMPPMPIAKVTLTDAFKGSHVVEVEVAATAVTRTRGMMWRTALEPGKGMLFIFPAEQPLSFWMRNTLIPLDMIFIGKDLKVTGIVSNAEPKTLESRGVNTPSMYVLEVPGGWAEKTGIKAGSAVKLDGTMGIQATP
jgi:uncharacterized protein